MASLKLGSKSDAFQRQGQAWYCTTGLPSDIIVEVGEMSFHLHKFPLLSRSAVLDKLISESTEGEGTCCVLHLDDIPGGAKAFELAAKFCYGIKLELTAHNVVYLRSAAEYLQMTEEYGEGNLIVQTEGFLNEVLKSWKDSIKALETCEDILPHAEELQIVIRCMNSLATKACSDPNLFNWPMVGSSSLQSPGGSLLWNGIGAGSKSKSLGSDWWYEDVSFLSLPLYKRLILAMESKGMKPENIAGSLAFYAKWYLPGLNRHSGAPESNSRVMPGSSVSAPSEGDQRVLLEEIESLLPMQKGVTTTKFLLGLLRTAMILQASQTCRGNLEKRVGAQLDQASLEDLLIPNLSYSVETLYDIDCVQRMLDHFLVLDQASGAVSPSLADDGQLMEPSSLTGITMVAKLIDGYLAEVASDVNLKLPKFQALAAVIPDYARPLDDGLYRAIDIYLKAHQWLTDSEREQLCRLMDCQKLSLEACTHAAQNERLPLRVVVQVLFFEQLRLRTSIAGWFFVSDNLDTSRPLNGSDNDRALPMGPNRDGKDPHFLKAGIDEMKLRMNELEKECSSMKQEIDKMGKTKSAWNSLSRKFRFRKSRVCNAQDGPVPTNPDQGNG
ncbi:hypothetical protein AMTRI_Chr07g74880 [Amborella trichopoda]|uniref:NPH3 domain-containing protein n=1 Tax=Amborella trichopoda TaxID=13333 RepID=W1PML0_AMBTC|nr:BTB/POZ domain-containing protein At1g30440 [Amborella trichopoda]ERN08400.1 hypothetical protein AMTR_s00148p00085230 [Amborella trichopoda]|eukprot:XP_006846819.1 BTB/POZ domain-containing protein At1g30440 [Amborella trichopoda]